ncbi:MAG: GTP-binding protein [Candidatus Lokiarchaeota archaeon]|nr:GTP-binding protein [Candidatus Lokiarchaeota archaeon]
MSRSSDLQRILDNLVEEIPELLAALVVDFNGFIIAKKSIKKFDDELIGGIMSLLDETLNRIKSLTQSELGSGSFDIDQFRLFYIQLGKNTGALLVLIGDQYSHLDRYVPYSYIIADKISLLLSNCDVACKFPSITEDADLVLDSKSKNFIIIGSEAVGKSTLSRRVCNDSFIENYHPTIGVSVIEKELETRQNKTVKVNIFDLSSLKSFGKVRRYFYQYSSAILIMFDYSKEESLNEVENWITEARQFVSDKEVPFLIVGNKVDLVNDNNNLRKKAEMIALNHNYRLFETSILNNQGLDEIFEYLINESFQEKGDKVVATPITPNFIKNLTEDEKIVFICDFDFESLDQSTFPNVLEKNIIKNIADSKEISLAILHSKLIPLEKALNRKIDKDTILKITDKYIKKGKIKRQFLKFDEDLETVNNSNIIQKGDI